MILIVAFFLYPVPVLELKTEKNDRILFLKRVSSGEPFIFQYVHSVEKITVQGFFIITSRGMIQLVETQFPSFGPGLPFMKNEVILEKDKMRATSKIEEMENFSFFVSPFTLPQLTFKDERFDFSSLKEGELVTLRVRRYPLGGFLLNEVKR